MTEPTKPVPATGANIRITKMTVAELIAQIPQHWRGAEVTVGNSIGSAQPVKRVALHRDAATGRRVVVLYEQPIEVRD